MFFRFYDITLSILKFHSESVISEEDSENEMDAEICGNPTKVS